ncbi:MAG: branched-chain amino acid ABC transporter permease [Clostridiales Family XIII bacterium]|jgi:branched-chain amino acid transport system permease protein|nr:branched-chain amino acid ABC transporter permease [Clostridiales Family XIII bacterium]
MAQAVLQGILLGGVFAVVGIGMSMIFGIVKLANLAHGEFFILGAYLSMLFAGQLDISPLLTLVIVVPLMFVAGYALQGALINRVLGMGDEPPLLITFGLSFILQNVLLLIFSADPQTLKTTYQLKTIVVSDSLIVPVLYLVNFIVGALVILILGLFLRFTYTGQAIRAVSDDNMAASLMGISVKRSYSIAMGIATSTAAVAGVVIGTTFTFYPYTGSEYLLVAFGVVVLGGMGSIPGTLVGGLVFGLARTIGSQVFGTNYQMMIGYIILLAMLMIRPQGLFSK